jgi:hypothetical protein
MKFTNFLGGDRVAINSFLKSHNGANLPTTSVLIQDERHASQQDQPNTASTSTISSGFQQSQCDGDRDFSPSHLRPPIHCQRQLVGIARSGPWIWTRNGAAWPFAQGASLGGFLGQQSA